MTYDCLIRFPEELKGDIAAMAAQNNCSINTFMVNLVAATAASGSSFSVTQTYSYSPPTSGTWNASNSLSPADMTFLPATRKEQKQ